MIKPMSLKEGDKVGVIAPCSPVAKDNIDLALNFLKSINLDFEIGNSVYESYGYLSGTDDIRSSDINKMFNDKTIKGIFAIRGGYGGARLLDKLDYKIIKKNPKIFAGYSDVTAIHNALNLKCKLITYHTPMIGSEFYKKVDNYTRESFLKAIFCGTPLGNIYNPDGIDFVSLNGGKAKGKLCGGNLSVIVSCIGTKYEINTKNKILFLEDVDEPLYKIDRMLLQLKQSNKFKDASGIILGTFKDCICFDEGKCLTFNQIIKDLILTENKPTISNVMIGHLLPSMSLPLGSNIFLDCDNNKIIDLGN